MITKEEIINDFKESKTGTYVPVGSGMNTTYRIEYGGKPVEQLTLEVLLDIRELLTKNNDKRI